MDKTKMLEDTIYKQECEIKNLKWKLKREESRSVLRIKESIKALENMEEKYLASAVVISIKNLGGVEVLPPTQIYDGLSVKAIAELVKDLERTLVRVKGY